MPHKEISTEAEFTSVLATKDRYVVIYLYATEVSPHADKAADKYAHNSDCYKVDVDKHAIAKDFFKVSTPPALLIFRNGKSLYHLEDVTSNRTEAEDIAKILV